MAFRSRQGSTLSPPEVEKIDTALAEFFFECNLSFNVVESDLFKQFIKLLNPSYKVPSRKKLSTTLLDKVYAKVTEKLKSKEETKGVLLIDGWKNSSANTKNVVCTIHKQNGTSLFLHSWDFSELRETGDELARVIDEAVDMAKERYNVNIYAAVSDNASAMMRMGSLISIWHTTCYSHSSNLLLKSLVRPVFAESVNKLLREFKTSEGERELKKRNGTRIMLACDTRWCTYRDTFRCCLKNLPIMRQLVKEGIIVLKEVNRELLEDSSFSAQLQDALVLFDPICQLVNTCQSSDRNIADAAELWLTLDIPVVDTNIDETLEKRLEKVLQPIALTANFLHPVYQGKQFAHLKILNSKVQRFIEKELAQEDPAELNGLKEFKEKTGVFKLAFKKNLTSPKSFWCLIEEDYPALAKFAERLLNIPSSSAQIERLFSNWSFIHSDLRNRLDVERSMKLVAIYYAFKMQDLNDNE